MHSNDKKIYSGAFVLAASCLVMLLWLFHQNELAHQPHLVSVTSTSFLQTKGAGSEIVYPLLHAQVIVPAHADISDLVKYAHNIFDAKLRSDAEAQAKNVVWITFTFGESPRKNAGQYQIYREVYVREGMRWHRLSGATETTI